MDPSPLVKEEIDAGARFLAEFDKCYPVQAAFWLTDTEERRRRLYVASEQITDENFDVAYGEVGRIAVAMQDPWFDSFQVRVIGAEEDLAKAVADIQRRHSGRTPPRFTGTTLGGMSVDEVYIYPLPIPVPG